MRWSTIHIILQCQSKTLWTAFFVLKDKCPYGPHPVRVDPLVRNLWKLPSLFLPFQTNHSFAQSSQISTPLLYERMDKCGTSIKFPSPIAIARFDMDIDTAHDENLSDSTSDRKSTRSVLEQRHLATVSGGNTICRNFAISFSRTHSYTFTCIDSVTFRHEESYILRPATSRSYLVLKTKLLYSMEEEFEERHLFAMFHGIERIAKRIYCAEGAGV